MHNSGFPTLMAQLYSSHLQIVILVFRGLVQNCMYYMRQMNQISIDCESRKVEV